MLIRDKIVNSLREQFNQYSDNGYIILFNLYNEKQSKVLENKIGQVVIDTIKSQNIKTSMIIEFLYKFDENLDVVGNCPINEIINTVIYPWLKDRVRENMGKLNSLFNESFLDEDWSLQGEIYSWLDRYFSTKYISYESRRGYKCLI